LDFGDLAGILEITSRTYSIDFAALMATPGASEDPASLDLQGVVTLIGYVAYFDDEENAERGWVTVNTEFANQAATLGGDEVERVESSEVDDLGDRATSYISTVVERDTTFSTAIPIVQESRFVSIGIGITAGDDPVPTTTAVVERMIDTDGGNEGAALGSEGFYSGGLWDTFPAVGDESLAGLAPLTDGLVSPTADTGTPEA